MRHFLFSQLIKASEESSQHDSKLTNNGKCGYFILLTTPFFNMYYNRIPVTLTQQGISLIIITYMYIAIPFYGNSVETNLSVFLVSKI